MPAKPTWQQVADIAAKVDGAKPGMARHLPARPARLGPGLRPADHGGEHLRRHLVHQGLAGPGRRAGVHCTATNFYVDLVRTHGENGRPAGRLHRVPEQPRPGQRGDVVRRDVRRGLAGGAGLTGARARSATPPAPVVKTKNSGWLYAWSWSIQQASKKKDNAWKFISWASGKKYENLVGSAARLVPRAGRQARLDLREPRRTSRRPRRSPSRPERRSRRPTRRTRASSRGRRSASSSSTSPSSPTSGPRSPRTSARRSPGQMSVDDALDQGTGARRRRGRALPVDARPDK